MTLISSRTMASALVLGLAFSTMPAQAQTMEKAHPNSIQPETTIAISATSSVTAEPDIAYLTGGVVSEAKTAAEALKDNTAKMQGVFAALQKAGLSEKNIQTSNFSVQPKWEFPKEGERYISGYTVTNQVTAKVEDLTSVGGLIDAMVSQGGNTFNGVEFALKDSTDIENQARQKAMKEAMARAQLYAEVTGYEVTRIVTINEGGSFSSQPRQEMIRSFDAKSAPTPISAGELTWSANVNVTFELSKK